MANMSYCRFENTLRDLRDCHEAMNEPTDKMNEYEKSARRSLFNLVKIMAEEIEDAGLLDGELIDDSDPDPMGTWHGRNE
jgi:hypothetical protein